MGSLLTQGGLVMYTFIRPRGWTRVGGRTGFGVWDFENAPGADNNQRRGQIEISKFGVAGVSMNCFQVLGLPQNATQQQIRQKFRQLVLVAHPDKGGSTKAFVILNKAYLTALEHVASSTAKSAEQLIRETNQYSDNLENFRFDEDD